MKLKALIIDRYFLPFGEKILNAYTPLGKRNFLIKFGQEPSYFLSYIELFDFVEIDFYQYGNLCMAQDYKVIKKFSLQIDSYEKFMYCSYVSLFVKKYLDFFDKTLFEYILEIFEKEIKNFEIAYVKFLIDSASILGYRPIFLEKDIPNQNNILISLEEGKLSDNQKNSFSLSKKELSILKKIDSLDYKELWSIKEKISFKKIKTLLEIILKNSLENY